jgi:hypothetical protein
MIVAITASSAHEQRPIGPGAAGQQDRRGHRPRPSHQRNGERESGDVIDGDRVGGERFAAVWPQIENHAEGDLEEHDAAGDAKGRHGDAQRLHRLGAAEPRKRQRMQKAMIAPRSAIWRFSDSDIPAVRPMKIGARPGGSSVASSVAKAVFRKSNSAKSSSGDAPERRVSSRFRGASDRPSRVASI